MPRSTHSPERQTELELPEGISSISESDYFLKSAEFRVWLKDVKGKVSSKYGLYLDWHWSWCAVTSSILMRYLVIKREGEYLHLSYFNAEEITPPSSYFRKFVKVFVQYIYL